MNATATASLASDVVSQAAAIYDRQPTWVEFFRQVLGAQGIVRQAFPAAEDRLAFERSGEYRDLQQMLQRLREADADQTRPRDVQRVITLRIPAPVHGALMAEAHDRRTSMNKLCIKKLLGLLDATGYPPAE